jgi:hypothetical protein
VLFVPSFVPFVFRLLRVLFGADPQLRRDRAFRHHGEVALHASRTDDEGILLANLSLYADQPRFSVGAVIFAVIGKNHRSACISRRFGDLLLRRDVFVPFCAVRAKRTCERAAGIGNHDGLALVFHRETRTTMYRACGPA